MGVDPAETEVPADAVGRRVSCDGERATVRFVGPVPPTEGYIRCTFYTNSVIIHRCLSLKLMTCENVLLCPKMKKEKCCFYCYIIFLKDFGS